jgi:Fur family ferric uptake transcriptional regulator
MKMKFNFIIAKEAFIKSQPFRAWISKGGLKATKQREEIFNIFLNSFGHKNLAQIYALVTKANPKIGYTTVYRTMKLLARLGLAEERKFADRGTRYEPISKGEHHDHFICLKCGKIIEFEDEAIESLQKEIAERYHFEILRHRMELYGRCADCGRKKGVPKR